ncbi:hypothetical protein WICPIJ_007300 [Wickerhamomyces pijperi]|uniref:Cytochrome c oxidase assembly factor 6 n=1 Tax=Wickerhamomyces pijperi TaxID=599730 RepID=A0A9P8TKK3_WICPI|nr:hypothetical protein WICPIJ_007300 [Wickerhamomyces pijperi]
MGLFSSSSSQQSSTTVAPNRSKREQCWESRDLYLDCLEQNKIDNPNDVKKYQEELKKCQKQSDAFDRDCAKSWVSYFKDKYVVDLKKERFLREMEEKGGKQLPFPIQRK